MKTKWLHFYKELSKFINAHDEIRISEKTFSAHGNIRPQFYKLFDKVRSAFIEHWRPEFSMEVNMLRKSFIKAEAEVKELLRLEEVSISSEMRRFLHDPKLHLMRELLDPLFDLLRGKVDEKEFALQSRLHLRNSYAKLYKSIYQKWTILILLKLVEADRNFNIDVPSLEISSRGPVVSLEPKPVPYPQESKKLTFQKENVPAFCTPEIIVHSKKMDRYLSFGANLENIISLSKVFWTATDDHPKRKWHDVQFFRGSLGLQSATLIYIHEKLEDTALIADSQRLAKPDAILEFICIDESPENGFERVAKYKDNLMPNSGVFIIVPYSSIKSFDTRFESDIKVITVGLEPAKLKPLAKVLIGSNI
jgi:hypothetical protein